MQSKPYRSGGVLALACFILAFPTASAGAGADSPFGEPELVLDLQDRRVQGPFPVGETALLLVIRPDSTGTLWHTDGTQEGTFSIHPQDGVSFLQILPTSGRYHWLVGRDVLTGAESLWRTDGTAEGTRRLADHLRVTYFGYHRGLDLLFFTAGAPTAPGARDLDYEPWVSDGTAAGTRPLGDLLPTTSSWPFGYREYGGEMAFLAADPAGTAIGLWLSDGTSEGTRLLGVPEEASFQQLEVSGSELHMVARNAAYELSFWTSRGTDGVRRLAELGALDPDDVSGATGLHISGDLSGGRTLWTVATEEVGSSLWVHDGTVAGTGPLTPLELSPSGSYPRRFLPFGGSHYFQADDGTTGLELWRTDGTPEGTEVAFETCPGPCSDFGRLDRVKDGRLLLWAGDPQHGMELRSSDGTAAGTELVLDLCPGSCSAETYAWHYAGPLALFRMEGAGGQALQLWGTDFTQEGTRQLTDFRYGSDYAEVLGADLIDGRHLFVGSRADVGDGLFAVPVGTAAEPPPPFGDWLASPSSLPGFAFKARISTPSDSILGTKEPACIPETVCVSGAIPGRSEVFLRVVGLKPNGFLWPTLVKFSTSTVEVWVRQEATGAVRYYRLEGARPGFDELPGLFDRQGFQPVAQGAASTGALLTGLVAAEPTVLAAGDTPAPPAGAVFTSPHLPDFRFRARISAGDQVQEVRQEAACMEETLCLSAAIPGRSEVFLRIVGPKPNGRLWPTIVKFTTSTLEVWVEQVSTGERKYYRIEGAAPGRDDLTGLFDRAGFAP